MSKKLDCGGGGRQCTVTGMAIPLLKNVRFYVLVFSLLLSAVIYGLVIYIIPESSLRVTTLTQMYALTAITYLYVTLLIGPAVYMFKWLPWRGYIHRSRRAIGVSVFYFASLHASLAFFGQLGGFKGLFFLNRNYLIAITLSFTALVILACMAATSFDVMVRRLGGQRWKMLHRFVYVAGVLIIVHAFLLGTHFAVLSNLIPRIFFVAMACLLLLEGGRVAAYLERRRKAATIKKLADV